MSLPSSSVRLTDQVALITGASRGLGAAFAEALAGAGATVVLASRDRAACDRVVQVIARSGGRAEAAEVDVRNEASVCRLTEAIGRDFGRLDILVNNAAVRESGAALDLPLAQWQEVLAVNLSGPFLMSREAARLMIPRGYGRIVNVTSMLAVLARPGRTAYSASKAGLTQLTRSLALEWVGHGIRVNAVAPTSVPTDRTAAGPARLAEILEQHPIGRIATPADFTGAVLFLASPQADYVTGQTIYVDGGRSLI